MSRCKCSYVQVHQGRGGSYVQAHKDGEGSYVQAHQSEVVSYLQANQDGDVSSVEDFVRITKMVFSAAEHPTIGQHLFLW